MKVLLYMLAGLLLISVSVNAQTKKHPIYIPTDSTTSTKTPALTKDTLRKVVGKDTLKIVPKHDPKKATIRSAIIPGWGQAYNREYWKIPIVYGAIGIPAGFFVYNNTWYKKTKQAYVIRVTNDTANFASIDPKLQPLSAESLRFYRNSFRRDRDYSVLYFFVAWGLNVIDATVFGHLKDFDVSPDLTLKFKPTFNISAKGGAAGLGLVLAPNNNQKHKAISL